MQVGLGNALYLLAHGGREEQRVTLGGHAGKDFVDAIGEAHVEHFVGLVEHYILHAIELGHAALHQVDETTGCGYDDLHSFAQGAYLALDAGTAVDSQHMQAVDVARVLLQVAGNLQAELARGAQDNGLCGAVGWVYFLQHGQTEGRRLARSRLGQGDNVVAHTQEVGNHFFLHGHRVLVAHL